MWIEVAHSFVKILLIYQIFLNANSSTFSLIKSCVIPAYTYIIFYCCVQLKIKWDDNYDDSVGSKKFHD